MISSPDTNTRRHGRNNLAELTPICFYHPTLRRKSTAQDAAALLDWERYRRGEPPVGQLGQFIALHYFAWRLKGSVPTDQAEWLSRYRRIFDLIVELNLPLCHAMIARKSRARNDDEALSVCSWALCRSIRNFNPWIGYRFSTYVCRAMITELRRLAAAEQKHAYHYYQCEELTDPATDYAPKMQSRSADVTDRLHAALASLNAQEKIVMAGCFPLFGDTRPLRLRELADMLGVTMQYISQVRIKSLGKLRKAMESQPV